jgi:hypothetical protein
MPKGQFNTKHRNFLRNKMIIRNKSTKGKSFEDIYGNEKAKLLKEKITIALTGHKMTYSHTLKGRVS